jgi:hypothetical protein
MRKKINHYLLIQWILFIPIIVPIGIFFGAIEGIRHTLKLIFDQAKQDINTEIKHIKL